MGEDRAPRSAGCSSMYSAPEECAARRSCAVRRTISFACADSRACCDGTFGSKAHDMIAVTDGRWPAVDGARSGIEAGYRESRARWRCKHGRVVAVGAALQQAFVHGIDKYVVRFAAAINRA
eukprot:2449632-Pleurochrysis_carterae.AAC.1